MFRCSERQNAEASIRSISVGSLPRQLTMLLLMPVLLLMTSCADWFDWDEEVAVVALPTRYVFTTQAPPMPIAEYVPLPSRTPTSIWRPGYWVFNGTTFEWIPGTMVERPSTTAIWSPDHWVKHTYGWGFVTGYWQ